MYANKLIVLKFGGSVLRSRDDQFLAAQEVYRWYKAGYKVVAIVSALQGETDRLFDLASQMAEEGSPYNVARLVSSGERESAALLGLVFDECGIPNSVLYEGEINLQTCGDPLDATPESIDVDSVRQRLDENPVLVIPGFVGRDQLGRVNLLGRGGSDLTAILIASWLQADQCRLVKDVDGLYEFDPKSDRGTVPARYDSVSWTDVLQLDKSILQHKAIQFAKDNSLSFEVAACLGSYCTQVGDFKTVICGDDRDQANQPVRVGLLGFGTVGKGVFEQLLRMPGKFRITRIGVRDLTKHNLARSLPNLFTEDWREVVDGECDVVVELMGGTNAAKEAVIAAMKTGKHLITANKSLIARCFDEVSSARDGGQQLRYSAAVGGGTPMLEAVDWLKNNGLEALEIAGILNGTTNFVLDLIARGSSFEEAVARAQEKGLAEADPSGDLSGNDAAEKLTLLCRAAGWEVSRDQVTTQPVTRELIQSLSKRIEPCEYTPAPLRQIALAQSGPPAKFEVAVPQVDAGSVFAGISEQRNFLKLQTDNQSEVQVVGVGAGRWPTTMSVVSDALAIRTGMQQMRDPKVASASI